MLLKLFDADAEYSADTLEGIYDELEKVSKQVLSGEVTDTLAGEALEAIARQEDLNGRIRRNVMDTRRAVSFMMRSRMLSASQFEEARQILRDIESLDNHTAFLFDKINFLMDATVGFINLGRTRSSRSFGGQRRAAAADADRQHLRHELPHDAGAGLVRRLPLRARPDAGVGPRSHVVLPQAGLAALSARPLRPARAQRVRCGPPW